MIQHHRIQGRCHVVVLDSNNTLVGKTVGLSPDLIDNLVQTAHQIDHWSDQPEQVDFTGYTVLAHEFNGLRYLELVMNLAISELPDAIPVPELTNNVFRFAQRVCEVIYELLDYDRVMVYRFHADFSGEVIAEAREESLDPFLGLHYPATDIPAQARALYAASEARIIYSAIDAPQTLEMLSDADIDQSRLSCRGVSPYHLQYLANMDSRSTASVAINVEGQLWGLISLHRSSAPSPDLRLFPLLRKFSAKISEAMQNTLALESESRIARALQLRDRFAQQLDEEFDIIPALLLSNHAIHRLTGGVGVGLVAGDVVVQVGMTPAEDVTAALVAHHVGAGDKEFYCAELDSAPITVAAPGFGGYAFTLLGRSPAAAIVVYRREVSQNVAWGGDPRRETKTTNEETVRYTPRGSFERWVETVKGRCIDWDDSTRETFQRIKALLLDRFATGSADNIGLVLAYSATQLVNARDRLRSRLNEQFNRQQQSIAIAIEDESAGSRRILSINEAASQAFNIAQREAEMMTLDTFSDVTSLPLDRIKSTEPRQVSVWTHDSGNRDLEVKTDRHLDYRNAATGASLSIVVYFLTDITESRRVELALQAAYLRSQRNAEIQTQVVSKLMHELRTPLNSILGFSTFLGDESIGSDQKNEFISRILHNANLLRQIVETSDQQRQLLKQQIDDERELVDLCELVRAALKDLSLYAAERGISLEVTIPDDQILVRVSPNSVEQVLINLVNNAVKFSATGDSVHIKLTSGSNTATFEVSDEGIGMSPEQVAEATVPFKRFTDRPGSGLGLSIVKQLVAGNDGEMNIHSILNEGTTVSVTLPTSYH